MICKEPFLSRIGSMCDTHPPCLHTSACTAVQYWWTPVDVYRWRWCFVMQWPIPELSWSFKGTDRLNQGSLTLRSVRTDYYYDYSTTRPCYIVSYSCFTFCEKRVEPMWLFIDECYNTILFIDSLLVFGFCYICISVYYIIVLLLLFLFYDCSQRYCCLIGLSHLCVCCYFQVAIPV